MGSYVMTSMIFRPWAGKVVNAYGPQAILRVLLISNVLVLSLYTVVDVDWYFILRAAQGVATAFFSLALQMGIVDAMPEKERAQGISLYLLAGMLPTAIGPLVAYSLWDYGGMHAFAWTIIGIGLVSCMIGYQAQLPSRLSADLGNEKADSFRTQLSIMFTHRAFLVSCLVMLIASSVYGAMTTFVALFSEQIVIGHPGVFFMIQAGTMVILRFTFRKKLPSDGQWHAPLVVGLLLCMGIGSGLLSLASYGGAAVMYLASFLTGCGMALLYPILVTYLTFVLPRSVRNVLIGLFIAVSDLGSVFGNLVMGVVADRLSYSSMYFINALLTLITVGIVCIASFGLRKSPGKIR